MPPRMCQPVVPRRYRPSSLLAAGKFLMPNVPWVSSIFKGVLINGNSPLKGRDDGYLLLDVQKQTYRTVLCAAGDLMTHVRLFAHRVIAAGQTPYPHYRVGPALRCTSPHACTPAACCQGRPHYCDAPSCRPTSPHSRIRSLLPKSAAIRATPGARRRSAASHTIWSRCESVTPQPYSDRSSSLPGEGPSPSFRPPSTSGIQSATCCASA
mmetsp:Transcript_40548/g.120991  ORF Transcript_40548/g.120991 Transcript_40548/m.120991 type:complete len:210 (-) Transcript_40548:44-673(-)